MNLAAYDIITDKRKIKTWIDVEHKILYTKIIPFHNYYYLSEKYDSNYDVYDIYIIVTNIKYDDPEPRYMSSKNNGTLKIKIKDIWNKIKNYNMLNVNLILEEKQEDCLIYKLTF